MDGAGAADGGGLGDSLKNLKNTNGASSKQAEEEPDFERADPAGGNLLSTGTTETIKPEIEKEAEKKEEEQKAEEEVKKPPKHLQKSQILGKKLTEYELHLYEYSAFSLTEEIDLFYCTHKQHGLAKNPLNLQKLRNKTQFILEILEQEPLPLPKQDDAQIISSSAMGEGKSESQKMREKSIQELYILSMGEYEWEEGVPEDGKPDNYICNTLPSGKFQLVCVDNDHSFAPASSQRGLHAHFKVKCILFCLDNMHETIDQSTRTTILDATGGHSKIDVFGLLESWLEAMSRICAQHDALFDGSPRSAAELWRRNTVRDVCTYVQ